MTEVMSLGDIGPAHLVGVTAASPTVYALQRVIAAAIRIWERERFARHSRAQRRDIVEWERAMRRKR